MCGRFTLTASAEAIAKEFQLPTLPPALSALEPRYNIAPTQPIGAIVEKGDREFTHFYWGLIPSWSKDPSIGVKMINARSETVAEKPSFRNALKKRRCLVVTDGFYEWKREGKTKQPYLFFVGTPEDRQPFAFAGLWEHWESAEGDWINSCTILTTAANTLMEPIHDRMPVILPEQDWDLWLDTKIQNTDALQELLRPYPANAMGNYAVGAIVNNARNEMPACIEPLTLSDDVAG